MLQCGEKPWNLDGDFARKDLSDHDMVCVCARANSHRAYALMPLCPCQGGSEGSFRYLSEDQCHNSSSRSCQDEILHGLVKAAFEDERGTGLGLSMD